MSFEVLGCESRDTLSPASGVLVWAWGFKGGGVRQIHAWNCSSRWPGGRRRNARTVLGRRLTIGRGIGRVEVSVSLVY